MELNLLHHVYSSLNGYRTLYSSPGLPKDLVEKAEAFDRRCYRLIGRRPLKAHYRPAPGWGAYVRGLPFGTDHVGRPRTCVHTIFLRDEETSRIPYYTPFEMPDDLFLVDGADLQYVSTGVQQSWEVPVEAFLSPAEILERCHLSLDLVGKFIPALLDTHRSTLVLDARGQAVQFAKYVACFLPSHFRETVSYLAHAFVPPVEGGTNFQLNFFANRPDPSILQYADWIILDIDRNEMHYPPVAPPFANFMLGAMHSNRPEAIRMLAMLETYERSRVLQRGHLTKVLDGFRVAGPTFEPDGRFAFQANPGAAYDSLPHFAEADCFNIVLVICRAIVVDVQARFGSNPAMVEGARRDVDLIARHLEDHPKAQHLVLEFHAKIGPVYGREIQPPPPGFDSDETFTMPAPPIEKTPTSLNLPSVGSHPPPDKEETDLFNVPPIDPLEDMPVTPTIEKCPTCGMLTVTTDSKGVKSCVNRNCTYRSELDFDP